MPCLFTEPLSNKLEMIRRVNSKSFNDHPELVKKATNKEDRYSHLVPIDVDICRKDVAGDVEKPEAQIPRVFNI